MKVVKILGLGLILIIGLWLLISLFLPSNVHIERTIEINSEQAAIYKQVNNLKTWRHWSYWDRIDPKMQSEFSGPDTGVGATHIWKSDHDSVGNGAMTITKTLKPEQILTSMVFENRAPMTGGWLIKERDQDFTDVTLFIDLNVGFLGRVFPGLMLDGWMGPSFNKSLEGLKDHCESAPPEFKPRYPFNNMMTAQRHVMFVKRSSAMDNISSTLGKSYELILTEIQKQGLEQSGPPFAFYSNYNGETVELEPGIEVSTPGRSSGEIIAKTIEPLNALRIDHYGSYDNIPDVYLFIKELTARKLLTVGSDPWESYVTDPGTEPDTSKWLTQIYFPISK